MTLSVEEANVQSPICPPEVPSQKACLEIVDRTGHTEVSWDPDDPEEVQAAQEAFGECLGKGYAAFSMQSDGKQGEQIRSFDPYAGRILMLPALVGG